jgi:hypothetical protein
MRTESREYGGAGKSAQAHFSAELIFLPSSASPPDGGNNLKMPKRQNPRNAVPWTPRPRGSAALPAFPYFAGISRSTNLSWWFRSVWFRSGSHSPDHHSSDHCVVQVNPDPELLADFRVIQAVSRRFKPKKKKKRTLKNTFLKPGHSKPQANPHPLSTCPSVAL